MGAQMLDEFNPALSFLFPELHVSVTAGCDKSVLHQIRKSYKFDGQE
jgi:hypothetical protein